jgi:hypothetical protein
LICNGYSIYTNQIALAFLLLSYVIFGTLLERALDADERHALGAHYTPRAYVERLVIPTIVEPLRDDWRSTQAVIAEQVNAGKPICGGSELQRSTLSVSVRMKDRWLP